MSITGVKIVMRAPSEDALEIDLMNEIVHDQLEADWFGGTTAQDFSAKVAGKTPKSITVRINSNGGSVSDGVAPREGSRRRQDHHDQHGNRRVDFLRGICGR